MLSPHAYHLPQGAQDLQYRCPLAVHEKPHAEDLGPGPQGPIDAQDQQDQADDVWYSVTSAMLNRCNIITGAVSGT